MNRHFIKLIGFFVIVNSCGQVKSDNFIIPNAGIKKINNQYLIDTAVILNNKNLDTLITQIENSKLIDKFNVKDIPDFINDFLINATHDNFSIANPGENWQSTDVIIEELPNRQLIYLGVGENLIVLAYYSGGIGESEHILVFRYHDKDIIDFWCGNVLKDVKTKIEILKLLKENKLKHWGLNTNIIYL